MNQHPFLIPSIMILLVSIPMVLGVVPRNGVYGIRTCKTLSDDAIWYPANRFGGWAMIIASSIYLVAASVTPYDRRLVDNFPAWTIHFCGFILPLLTGIIVTLFYVRKL